jgi:hypothetical protein
LNFFSFVKLCRNATLFFDLEDAGNEYRDDDGMQLVDLRAAKEQGLKALFRAMEEALPKVPSRKFS